MDLYEYQGRELFAKHGLPVLAGGVAETPEEAGELAERLGGRVVVKAQVKVGGRGKAGGVKLADTAQEAQARAADILGMDIKGHTVHKVMITITADIAEEYYFSYLLDRANRSFLCIASVAGGMDIEQVAEEDPEKVAKVSIDPNAGVDEAKAREIVNLAGFPSDVADQVVSIAVKLWAAFLAEDATLVEVNPLAKTPDGQVLCLDAKVTLDENAGFRHPDHEAMADKGAVDPLEQRAKEKDLNYVKLDGEVGIIGNGAGLVMSTLDVVAYAGEDFGGVKPANFLDIGGGASAAVMANGLEIVLSDPSVTSRSSSTCSAASRPATRWPTASSRRSTCSSSAARRSTGRWSSGSTATTRRRGGPSSTAPAIPWWNGWTRWTAPRGGPPNSRPRGGTDMAIWLTKGSRVIVQGMTGSEGSKHTRRMLAAGTNIVGGVNPSKAGQQVDFDGTSVPVFASVARRDGPDRRGRHGHLRPAEVRQGRGRRGDRRRHRPRRRDHRGHPGARHRRVLGARRRRRPAHADHRPELPRHRLARALQRGHHPGRHHRRRAASAW